MIDWISNIYNALIASGIIIILFTIGTSTSSGLTGTIIGYSFVITGILLLSGNLMNNFNVSTPLISKIITLGPFILLIGILITMIYLLSFYFNEIINGNVSGSYYNFMNIFAVLLLILFGIFYSGTRDKVFKNDGVLNKITGLFLYLIEVINIIVIIILATILKYFSTDG